MDSRNRIVIIILTFVFLQACKKESACFHSHGVELEIPVYIAIDEFEKLETDGDFHVNLVKDNTNYIEISGGKNSVEFIDYELEGDKLILKDGNKCAWLRDYDDRIEIEVHFTSLKDIRNVSEATLGNEGTLDIDTLTIHQNGTGDITLNLSSQRIWTESYVIGDITLSGTSASLVAKVASFGHLNASTLKAGWVSVTTTHEGDAHVYPVNALKAVCEQIGDIYYYNSVENPNITESEEGTVTLVTQ